MKKFYTLLILIIILDTASAKKNNSTLYFGNSFNAQNSFVTKDSVTANDSSKLKKKEIFYIKNSGLLKPDENGLILEKSFYRKTDYQSMGNILTHLPFSFYRDMGHFGQPNEITLYGYGFNAISYLENGISINNPFTNSLDLHNFQSEYLDSLEYISLPQSFIYGSRNNPVTVNFITRDNITKIPYTRLRVLQGPSEEGYIDAIFDAYVMRKINLTFELTNSIIEEYFTNTEFSSWKGAMRIRYLYSKYFNITCSINYLSSNKGLNGGNDFFEGDMYDETVENISLVKNRYQKETNHNYRLKFYSAFIKQAPLSLTFYYNYNLLEFRQNEHKNNFQKNILPIINNNKTNLVGSSIKQNFVFKNFDAEFISNYEQVKYKLGLDDIAKTRSYISLSGKANLHLADTSFNPTLFGKYLKVKNENYLGFGAEGNVQIDKKFFIYGGISYFEKPLSIVEEELLIPQNFEKQKFKNLEIGASITTYPLKLLFAYFYSKSNQSPYPIAHQVIDTLLICNIGEYRTEDVERSGINLKAELSVGKINFAFNSTYFIDNKKSNLPKFALSGNLYYSGKLFNNNLELKAGINFYATGSQNYYQYDFQQSRAFSHYLKSDSFYNIDKKPFIINTDKVKSSYSFDLFVAGTFSELATVYLTLENLLDKKYYIVPYYPKRPFSFRLGVSWEFYK